jgi:hypothetical protein
VVSEVFVIGTTFFTNGKLKHKDKSDFFIICALKINYLVLGCLINSFQSYTKTVR